MGTKCDTIGYVFLYQKLTIFLLVILSCVVTLSVIAK